MKIMLNDEDVTLTESEVNVTELLKLQEVEMPEMLSVSVNGDVLLHEAFGTTMIKDGDKVDFIYFMGGGS